MMRHAKYLLFGLLVLSAYWYTARRGLVYWSDDGRPSGPGVHTGGALRGPTFWGGGFQGGK